jgi:anti-sigma B factor antagonist
MRVSQPLSLDTVTVGSDCALVKVGGEVDVYTATQLREAILGLIADGVAHVIADLRAVEFLDSTGLGAIVGAHKRLRTNDGSLILASSPERILRLFRITGLDNAFTLYQTVPEAIASSTAWQEAISSDIDDWCRENGLL